jgi:hypothetical protein
MAGTLRHVCSCTRPQFQETATSFEGVAILLASLSMLTFAKNTIIGLVVLLDTLFGEDPSELRSTSRHVHWNDRSPGIAQCCGLRTSQLIKFKSSTYHNPFEGSTLRGMAVYQWFCTCFILPSVAGRLAVAGAS